MQGDGRRALAASIVRRVHIFQAIDAERDRQEALRAAGRFAHTCASPNMADGDKLACLGEEFGEVAKALLQLHGTGSTTDATMELRKELIEVAAVAVAWVEALDV